MGANVKLFWILSSFYFLSAIGYTWWGLVDEFHGAVEWVGTPALGLLGVMFAFIAFYLGRVHKAQGGELVEDLPGSTVDEGADLGFYSPWSWWPLAVAFAVGLFFLGLAVGAWMCFIGASFAFVAIVGWVLEYYRGNFAR
ncbi:MAG: cytochrome c oxidase subunit 4 [Terrimesophilobacter sp.]